MRTTPLWGISSRTRFLHDGRANSVHDAIMAHGGQGAVSRNRYARLGILYQTLVHRFLKTL